MVSTGQINTQPTSDSRRSVEWFGFVAELRSLLASVPVEKRGELLAELPPEVIQKLRWEWRFMAREKQLAPEGAWDTWLVTAGRGFGKTRLASEWAIEKARTGSVRLALVGTTAADCRDVMVEGESGILTCSPPWFRPTYEPSKRRLTWPNGAVATTYSAEEPDSLRGPQHHYAWCDELAKWKYVGETYDQLQFGLRLGDRPQCLITTTPRPIALIKELVRRGRDENDPTVVLTTGSTYENRSNLAPAFLKAIEDRYAGTRLGRQELEAELLEDVEGALWKLSQIEGLRVRPTDLPPMKRVVVAVDPSGTAAGDECGIVVAGLGHDGLGYVLSDHSAQASPAEWAAIAVRAYHDHEADRVIAEANFGGDMVENTIRAVDRSVSYRKVTASRGKLLRAEPVAALYEQQRVRHAGAYPELETEMTSWTPGEASPNRLDALVWAITELMLGNRPHSSGMTALI